MDLSAEQDALSIMIEIKQEIPRKQHSSRREVDSARILSKGSQVPPSIRPKGRVERSRTCQQSTAFWRLGRRGRSHDIEQHWGRGMCGTEQPHT